MADDSNTSGDRHWFVQQGAEDKSLHLVVKLTNESLFLRNDVKLEDGTSKIEEQLKTVPDKEFFAESTMIDLASIRELRCSKDVLEIHRDSEPEFLFYDELTRQHREVFDALRNRLAPNAPVVEGSLSSSVRAENVPLAMLLISVVLGGIAIVWSFWADPQWEAPYDSADYIDDTLAKWGPLWTIVIVIAAIALSGFWLAYVAHHAPKAEIIKVADSGSTQLP